MAASITLLPHIGVANIYCPEQWVNDAVVEVKFLSSNQIQVICGVKFLNVFIGDTPYSFAVDGSEAYSPPSLTNNVLRMSLDVQSCDIIPEAARLVIDPRDFDRAKTSVLRCRQCSTHLTSEPFEEISGEPSALWADLADLWICGHIGQEACHAGADVTKPVHPAPGRLLVGESTLRFRSELLVQSSVKDDIEAGVIRCSQCDTAIGPLLSRGDVYNEGRTEVELWAFRIIQPGRDTANLLESSSLGQAIASDAVSVWARQGQQWWAITDNISAEVSRESLSSKFTGVSLGVVYQDDAKVNDESSISLFPKRFLRFAETAAPLPEGPRPLEELDSDDDFEEIQQRKAAEKGTKSTCCHGASKSNVTTVAVLAIHDALVDEAIQVLTKAKESGFLPLS